MRLMQALKYTAAAFVRFVVGSDAFAARGIAGIHAGDVIRDGANVYMVMELLAGEPVLITDSV